MIIPGAFVSRLTPAEGEESPAGGFAFFVFSGQMSGLIAGQGRARSSMHSRFQTDGFDLTKPECLHDSDVNILLRCVEDEQLTDVLEWVVLHAIAVLSGWACCRAVLLKNSTVDVSLRSLELLCIADWPVLYG